MLGELANLCFHFPLFNPPSPRPPLSVITHADVDALPTDIDYDLEFERRRSALATTSEVWTNTEDEDDACTPAAYVPPTSSGLAGDSRRHMGDENESFKSNIPPSDSLSE